MQQTVADDQNTTRGKDRAATSRTITFEVALGQRELALEDGDRTAITVCCMQVGEARVMHMDRAVRYLQSSACALDRVVAKVAATYGQRAALRHANLPLQPETLKGDGRGSGSYHEQYGISTTCPHRLTRTNQPDLACRDAAIEHDRRM